MGTNIVLPALEGSPRPATYQPIDPLEEFQRASALKSEANQQQMQQQQIQMQQQQLDDAKRLRELGPQFIQKDENGKVTGFDTEGYLNAANGVNPQLAAGLRGQYYDSVLKASQATKAVRDNEKAQYDELHDIGAGLLDVLHKNQPSNTTPQGQNAAPTGTQAQQTAPNAPVPGTGGMPAFELPNLPANMQGAMSEQPPVEGVPAPAQATPEMMAAWHAALPRIVRLNPAAAAKLNPNRFPSEAEIMQDIAGAATRQQILADAEQQAKIAKERAEATKANQTPFPELGIIYHNDTGQITKVNGDAMSPAMLESKYVMNQAKKAAGQPLSQEDQAFDRGFEKYKTLVPAFNFNLQAGGVGAGGTGGAAPTGPGGAPLSYADQIKSFGPKGGVVAAIIEGRQDPPASFAQKSPYWQDVMQKVYAVDPQFNQQRAQLRKDYTVGKHSTEINAINTATGHLGELDTAIDALKNGNIPVLNSIANRLGIEVGHTPQTTLETIVHRVGPELSKAYLGAGGSAGERGADQEDFGLSKGNDQLKSNAAITAKLLRSKISGLENQWDQNRAPSMPSFQDQFISPAARSVLNKLSPEGGGQGGTTRIKASDGSLHDIPTINLEKAKQRDPGLTVVNQ